jgi:hypothetical protein
LQEEINVFDNQTIILTQKPVFVMLLEWLTIGQRIIVILFSIVSLFISILGPFSAHAQHIKQVHLEPGRSMQAVKSEMEFHAIVVKAGLTVFNNMTIVSGNDLVHPLVDEHYEPVDGFYHSNPILFPDAKHEIIVKGLAGHEEASLFLISLPDANFLAPKPDIRSNCDKPAMIDQDDWRAGLPIPDYERIFNRVGNIIIHHSATENSITNYTDLVRSIYVYHTQINGWSDIGYNYLIAPDGSIYAGRDPGDKLYEDEVLGAHFCASNTGTMGICLLGSFSETKPTDEALHALNEIISWKSAKDSLWPLGQNSHPLNQHLAVVAGHRHGCATLCPGDTVLSLLQTIRLASNVALQNCGIFLQLDESANERAQLLLVPNPVSGRFFEVHIFEKEVLEVFIYSVQGKQLDFSFSREPGKLTIDAHMKPGFYLLIVVTNDGVSSTKIVKTI